MFWLNKTLKELLCNYITFYIIQVYGWDLIFPFVIEVCEKPNPVILKDYVICSKWDIIRSKTVLCMFNLFIPALLTENILKVWDSHKTQLYCSQIGLRFFY